MTGAANASRGWARSLGSQRLAAIRTLEQVDRRRHLPILAFPALWVGAGLLAIHAGSWWLRLPAMIVIGLVIHGLGVGMHEAIHGNLFRRRTADRWAAFFLGLPALVSGSAYRVTHLAHHRHNRGELDPDEFAHLFRGRRTQSLAFWVWALFGLPIFVVHVALSALKRARPRERRTVLLEYAALIAIHAGVWALLARSGRLSALVWVWALPLLATWAIVSLRGWSEHMLTRPEHPLTSTRTVTSNRVMSFLMLNLNYHLEHHLFPGVPWYNLPRLHRLLEAEYRAAGAPIYRSYLRFVWDAARRGFHGLAPDSTKEGHMTKPSCPPGPSRRILWIFPVLIAWLVAWNLMGGETPAWRWAFDPLLGFLVWTLVEYVSHRWLFHIVPTSAWLRDRQQHLAHHAAPMEQDYYVIPLWLSLPVAGALWSALRFVAGSWRAAGLMLAGSLIGYVAYEVVHYEIHQGKGRGRLLRAWRRHHLYHHFRDDERCFGFTTSIWDVVFGTARPRRSLSRSHAPKAAP